MRIVSCCFNIIIVTRSPATAVIYSSKFLILNILGADFLPPKSGHHREN